MRSVLIVDDERLIREGLRTLIDWEAQGFTVTGLAEDGASALELHARQPADLIITDIRMPRLDGLDLLQTLRAHGDPVRVMILSGHAEFEYARRAASLGVEGYLLKPVDEDELVGQLAEIRRKLDARPVSFGDLLAGSDRVPADLDWGRWQVALLTFPHRPEGPTPDEEARFRAEVRAAGLGEAFLRGAGFGLLLQQVYPGGRNADRLARQVETALGPALCPFQAGLGPVATTPSEIAVSARQAAEFLGRGFFSPPSSFTAAAPEAGRAPDPRVWADLLSLAAETGLAAQVQTVLRDLFHALQAARTEAEAKELLVRTVGPVSWAAELWKFPFLSGLEAFVAARYEEQTAASFAGGPGLADRMTEVIESRYAEPLKLETLADLFGYNAAYLGKLYRSKTGESFNAALDRVRIRQAQLLLAQGYKVYQVAELVGYKYVDYFHAKFKKLTGQSPSQYKP